MALWLLPFLASGQFALVGTVTDASDGSPLPGAHVIIKETFKGVFTGIDGSYKIEGLPSGRLVLRISYLGFETIEKTIDLDAGKELNFSLHRSATLTDEIIVRATRAETRTPATYTNLSRDELSAGKLGQDMPFLLGLTPSLITSSDAGTGIGYTWMNIRGSDNSRINVTMNGIPLNDAESHGVWWVNMPDIVSSTDNVQIQRGVGLSTHGAGAFGGTISMQTLTLRDEPYAEVSSSVGSFNTFRNSVGFGTGLINRRWAFDGRLSAISSDGYVDRASADLRSYYLSGGYYGNKTVVKAVSFSGSEKTYQAWYGVPSDSLETNRTFNPAGLYYDDEGNIRYYDNETDNYRQDHYQLHVTHAFRRNLTANISGHYTFGRGYYEQYRPNERFSRYNLPNVVTGDEEITRSDLIRRRWLDNHFYGFTYSLNYDRDNRMNLTLGGGYNIYRGDHFGEIIWARYAQHANIRHRYYENDAIKKDFNTFAKAGYEMLEGLYLFADLQFRHIAYNFLGLAWVQENITQLQQDADFRFFNPKLGLNYEINPSHRVYLYGGIGNREPVRRDFTESSPESRPRPETLRNIETGYSYKSRNLMLSANVYLMDYKDQLVLTGEINDVGGFTRTNIDRSYRYGIELEAGLILSGSLQWQGNLSLSRNIIPLFTEYVDAYDENWNWTGFDVREYRNTEIAFSPPVTGASRLSWDITEGLAMNLDSKYVGRQYIDNTSSPDRMLDAYLVHNLRLNYRIFPAWMEEMQFTLQVNNLLNAKYSTNAWIYKGVVDDLGLITISDGYFPQAGTHFLAGVSLSF